jgi:hypothetical protein
MLTSNSYYSAALYGFFSEFNALPSPPHLPRLFFPHRVRHCRGLCSLRECHHRHHKLQGLINICMKPLIQNRLQKAAIAEVLLRSAAASRLPASCIMTTLRDPNKLKCRNATEPHLQDKMLLRTSAPLPELHEIQNDNEIRYMCEERTLGYPRDFVYLFWKDILVVFTHEHARFIPRGQHAAPTSSSCSNQHRRRRPPHFSFRPRSAALRYSSS